jgi:hypothetical protein
VQNSDGPQSALLEQSCSSENVSSGPQVPKQLPGMLSVHASIWQLPLQQATPPPP